MPLATKTRASKQPFQSLTQLTIEGFETPFAQKLDSKNRWAVLGRLIPWDDIVGIYFKVMRNSVIGASSINPRVALGALIIKHLANLSDEETILQIQENMYMQYFLGFSSFNVDPCFDPSLFVEIRKRLGVEQINAINEKIIALSFQKSVEKGNHSPAAKDSTEDATKIVEAHLANNQTDEQQTPVLSIVNPEREEPAPKGRLLVDATACPQDIAYPTDLNLLNEAREKSEELIDFLYETHPKYGSSELVKPRTYRENARKDYLLVAKKKKKTSKQIRRAIREQLQYLNRNIGHINGLMDGFSLFPLKQKEQKYLWVITELYRQQHHMWEQNVRRIEDRIVSIHQPHVRPIVRGKQTANTEFGAKIHVGLVNGYAFLDHLSWDAFNESTYLKDSVEAYKRRFGYYPEEVLADQIYGTRANRELLKSLQIKLHTKPLGRPPAVKQEQHIRPGERNPIEGKFGQAKIKYGLNRIRARLKETSQSWIASIFLVLNLVKLAGVAPLWLYLRKSRYWSNLLCGNLINYRVSCVMGRGLLFQ